MLRGRALVYVVVFGIAGCASARGAAPPPAPSLADRIATVIDAAPMDQVHWGILAVERESGRVLYRRNDARKFIPASNQKLLVTVAALDVLGPDHRFVTELRARGALEGSALEGDLLLVASGDPTLSERYWDSDTAALDALADSVAASGIREVRGRLLVDVSAFDSTTVAGTWMWSNLPGSYSANPGAFAIAEGVTTLEIEASPTVGEPAVVRVSPAGSDGFVVASVLTADTTVEADVDVGWLPESRRLHVVGSVPAGTTRTVTVATRDPVRQSAAALRRALERRGILVAGGEAVLWEPAEVEAAVCGNPRPCEERVVARLLSPPLIEIVKGILEPSQNWMTEQLVRALGVADSTRGAWGSGLRAVERTLVEDVGVDSLDLSLHDGSGLSAYNLVTPRALVRVLGHALEAPWGEAYRRALAEPGEDESTLRSRLEGLEGRLWGKTGTISNVNSLSGVLVDAAGRDVVFSILTNGSGLPSGPVRAAIDEVARALAGTDTSPRPGA